MIDAVNDLAQLTGRSTICHICKYVDMIRCCHSDQCGDYNLFFEWRGAQDMIKVVRCKDCIKYNDICYGSGSDDGYCSDGEPRGEK